MTIDRRWWATLGVGVIVAAGLAVVAGRAMRAQREDAAAHRDAHRQRMRAIVDEAAAGPCVDCPSNVTRADYVGPEACAGCHPENAARWRASLHATMNQLAGPGAIAGDFGGVTVAYGGGRARFERRGDAYRMVLVDRAGTRRAFRVTRTIGTRGLQEYVGVEEGVAGAIELRLPWAWWIARAGWYPQPYYDSWFDAEWPRGDEAPRFDAFAPDPAPWAARCAWCHNTVPFALRGGREGVGHGPERYVAVDAPAITDGVLPIEQLVTVGISCESCHLGGRAHASEPEAGPPPFQPVGACVRAVAGVEAPPPGDRTGAIVQGTICAQCHSAPTPRYPGGRAMRNSSESLDLAGGGCASELRCVDCHDPHARGPAPGGPDRPAHVAACVRCHEALADPSAARAHSGHGPAEASCLDCHLPRIVQGIGDVVRSHRITSPGEVAVLAAGSVDACNLCHLDRSIRWTVAGLAALGVSRTLEPAWLPAYGGDFDYPVGTVWLGNDPYVRMVAAAAFARAGDRAALPALVEILDDPVANTRMWILFAIERLIGRRLDAGEYDPLAPPAVRDAQWRRLRAWAARGGR